MKSIIRLIQEIQKLDPIVFALMVILIAMYFIWDMAKLIGHGG